MPEAINTLVDIINEESYYDKLIENATNVYIYLINGIKLTGVLGLNSGNIIILKSHDNQSHQMIYKNSISTVVPVFNKSKKS